MATQEMATTVDRESNLDVTLWEPRKFVSFFFFSLWYGAMVAFQTVRVLVPAGCQGVLWVIKSAVKMVVLFFSLLVLIIGPRIGLPRAVYQTTWKVLVKLGLVSTDNIMRAGRDAAAAAAASDDAALTSLTGALVRVGYQNMDLMLAANMVGHTVQGLVSDVFWATVDLLGLGGYFRSVAHHKVELEKRDKKQQHDSDESDEEIEEVFTEDPHAQARRNSHASTADTTKSEGRTVALVLHKAQRASEWGIKKAHQLFESSKERAERSRRVAQERRDRMELIRLERELSVIADQLSTAEEMASFAVPLAQEADEDMERYSKAVREAELAYERAMQRVESGERVPDDELEEAELCLLRANRECTDAMSYAYRRGQEREEAFADLKRLEAVNALKEEQVQRARAKVREWDDLIVKAIGWEGKDDARASLHRRKANGSASTGAASSNAPSSNVESAHVETSRVASSNVESTNFETSRVASSNVESTNFETSRVASSNVESTNFETSRVASSNVESSNASFSDASSSDENDICID